MLIRDLLDIISKLADANHLSKPYLVGGVVRDKLLGILSKVEDLDITCGDEGSFQLPQLLKETIPNISIKVQPDHHSQIIIDGIKVDFSSNYRSPQISAVLNSAGLKNPTELQKEAYSRDFTCCALLMDLNVKEVLDPTGMGVGDIQKKILRTCLPARITLADNLKRIPRVFYLAAKLNFSVDDEIIKWIGSNGNQIQSIRQAYVVTKLNQAVQYNKAMTIDLLDRCRLWQHLPPIPSLSEEQIKRLRQ
jgi:tRNA nucleotidyltransferase/poly(A) polymerase